MKDGSQPMPVLRFGAAQGGGGSRVVAHEVAVALSFNGTTQAVMMATPADLVDFAYGFSASEGIATPDQIDSVEVVEGNLGLDLQIWLRPEAEAALAARRRVMAGPVGCGLCGIDSLEQALRPVQTVPVSTLRLTQGEVQAAMVAIEAHQPLHDTTRAAHAAAFWTPEAGIIAAREDVGRHNALDKLIGALIRQPAMDGALVLTSRLSIDLVQKAAILGTPMIIAASAPTTAAIDAATAAGITLIGLARPDGFQLFTHSERILPQEAADVA
jgi:FdhD protein